MRLVSTKPGVSVAIFVILAVSTVFFSTRGIAGIFDGAAEKPAEEDSYTPKYWMKLILKDGTQKFINPEGVFLPAKNSYGRFELPLGALRAVKFIESVDKNAPNEIIVRFQNGLIRRMQLDTRRNYIVVKGHGRSRERIEIQNIMGILGPTFFDNNSSKDSSSLDDKLWRYTIKLTDGTTEDVYIPVTVLTIKTSVGKLHLPTPMLYSIKKKADSQFKNEITTIGGEIIAGNISGNHIRVIASNNCGYRDINLKDIKQLKNRADTLPITNNWFEWYIRPELAVAACFHSRATGLSDGERPLMADDVATITQTVVGIYCIKNNGTPVPCKQHSRTVKIALMSTGDILSVPWRDVNSVKNHGRIETKELISLMAPKPSASPFPASDDSPITDGVKLKTAIGNLRMKRDDISRIIIDRPNSVAAITTVYGDTFLIATPSNRQLAEILEQEDYEMPDDDAFTLTINKPQQQTPATNRVLCRLRSGDIFSARLPQQTLKVSRKSRSSRTTEIDSTSLSLISRTEDDGFYFVTGQGVIEARPKQNQIALVLDVTGETNEIPFKLIESISTASDNLPPPLCFRPGMTPEMRGEVLVKGGTFLQGSETGMDDEQPVHKVTLSSFYIDAGEVTRNQFAEFVSDSRYKTVAEIAEAKQTWKEPGFEQSLTDPVVCISWLDAAHYCNWRSEQCGLTPCYTFDKDNSVSTDLTADGYRLPTEAEWEYAARSRGENNMFACGYDNSHNLLANGKDVTSADPWMWTCPVKYFPPNSIGLYGMSGNAWEWCQDWYFSRSYLQHRQSRNPCVRHDSAPGLTRRVMRGGSYRNSNDMLRCASRGNGIPFAFAPHVGFRCARSAE